LDDAEKEADKMKFDLQMLERELSKWQPKYESAKKDLET
jgi:hypothetical protein